MARKQTLNLIFELFCIFDHISRLFLPLDQLWKGLERREMGIGWCFLFLSMSVSGICIFIIDPIWACNLSLWPTFKGTSRPGERRRLFDPAFFYQFYFLSILFFIYSNLLSIECFFQTLKGTSRPREREEDSLTQFLSLSLLISVFTYLCFVICDYRYLAARHFYIYVRSFAYLTFIFIIFG